MIEMLIDCLLQSDIQRFHSIINKYNNHDKIHIIDQLSISGHNLLHNSILMKSIEFIKLLLLIGSNPNIIDLNGNNSAHLAVYCGYNDILELLSINSKIKCDYERINNNNMTPFEISNQVVTDDVVNYVNRYYHHNDTFDQLKDRTIDGRKKCQIYLSNQIVIDRKEKENQLINESVDIYNKYTKYSKILLPSGLSGVPIHGRGIVYPQLGDRNTWSSKDKEIFYNNNSNIDNTITKYKSNDIINSAIHNNLNNMK